MKNRYTWNFYGLIILIMLLAIATSAGARTLLNEQSTVTIPAGEYVSFPFQLERGDELHYEFSVINGRNINAFIVDDADFSRLQNGQHFNYYGSEQSATGYNSDNITFSVPDDANYYLVFSNDIGGQGSTEIENSTINYSIKTTLQSANLTEDDLWFIAPLVFVLIIGIISFAKRRMNVKTDSEQVFNAGKRELASSKEIQKQTSLIKRWKYLRQLDKGFKEMWRSPPHKVLIYAFSTLLVVGGITLLVSGIYKEMDVVSVFILLNLLALPLDYEEIRLAMIEWRQKRLITNTLLVPGTIIFLFIFVENIKNPYDTLYSFALIIYLVSIYVLVFFRPLDLFLTKAGRRGYE